MEQGLATITLILPATDETYSLVETVKQCSTGLPGRILHFIIVTSPKFTTPECRETITKLEAEYGSSVVSFDQTRPGLGGAIQDAFDKTTGDYVVLMASDLETDPVVLPQMIAALDKGADIAATTRWKSGGGFAGYNPLKLVLNYGFQLFFRILYFTNLSDLTYAYRAYRTEIIKKIRFEETKFPFLFECLLKPLRLGYKAVEIPVPWKARTEGKSHATPGQIVDYTRVGLKVRFMKKSDMLYTGAHE